MKKIIALFVATTLLSTTISLAQSRRVTPASKNALSKKKKRKQREGHKFNFSIGLSLAASNTVTTTVSDSHGTATTTRSASAVGIFAYPKYSFISKPNYSISFGIPLTIAFAGSANSRTGENTTTFLYDLPFMIDYNGGVMCPAQRYSDKRLGYFGGVGFGMENTDASYSYESNGYQGPEVILNKAKSVGPNVHAGIVFRLGSEEKPHFIGLRLSYKIGLNSDRFNYFTPSVFLNL